MNNKKILLSIVFALLFAAVLVCSAFAATPSSGYMKDTTGAETNIKWTMTAEGLLTFEIDPAATDKVQTTVIPRRDPVDGSMGSWNKCLPTFEGATKVIVGDGITELNGLMKQTELKIVEIPASLVTLGGAAFESSPNIESIYIRGTEPVVGTYDLSKITKFGNYLYDGGAYVVNKIILNPDFAGELPLEFIKAAKKLEELEIPAGTTVIKNKALSNTPVLKVLTVLGMETVIESDDVFAQNTTYPAIKAKAGSKSAEFAKANGYTFIDLDTGEETKGTKATTSASTGGSSGGTSGGSTTTPAVTDFNPEGATVWGHSSGKYNGGDIINTWWAYYDDTKTLEFVSATTKYNETGSVGNVDQDGPTWNEYKEVIEHVIVGDNIAKISGSAFLNYTALKDIRMGKNVTQIDPNAFNGCTSLTTIWRDGAERIEGRADLTGILKVNDAYRNTAISEIVLPSSAKELTVDLSTSIKTIYAHDVTESLIEYAKTNLYNVQSIKDPSIKHEYWVYVDPTLPSCGGRSVFDFDEATGTLTVYGAGKIDDIVNYYGGGSKNQPWFSIRDSVKHIILSDAITSIGKYAFCEFSNLETVQIPASESFEILNAAFEKCSNLKAVYRSGSDPIEGTVDIRNVHTISPWTFAYDFLIANVIISPQVEKIGTSVFEENITVNLKNLYGTPGSYAESYAAENGLTFLDISANTPAPITCNPPETTVLETEAPETTAPVTEIETETETETSEESTGASVTPGLIISQQGSKDSEKGGDATGSIGILPIIIIVAAVVVVAVVAVVIIIVAKKKKK